MLRSARLINFKAFSDVTVSFGALTLLTGTNSSGKSSVLQALLLAHLSGLANDFVQLNGVYGLALGEADDVLHRNATSRIIEIAIETEARTQTTRLEVPDDERAVVLRLAPTEGASDSPDWTIGTYLSAERLGPRDVLEVAPTGANEVDVGAHGEFTAYALAKFERRPVASSLLHPTSEGEGIASTLSAQSEAWLSSIVRPIRIQASWLPQASGALLRFRDPEVTAEWTRPANVGFGLTYALPVVVAGLAASTRATFLVENPEAHLHPRGQSQIGRFLARVAASGVQTVVETHSDHVLNGIRLAVAQERLLGAEQVAVHFFDHPSDLVTISLSETGSLSRWPLGFFDQAEQDLATVARIRHAR